MSNALVRFWWVLALRGVFAVLFGILAFAWPGWTVASLVLLFGAYAFVDGIFALLASVQQRERWWTMVLAGLVGIGAGVVTFIEPSLTAVALLYLIGSWAVITGVLEIAAAIRLRKTIKDEMLLAFSGVASIGFGVLLMLWPGPGILALLWLIGSFALIYGAMMIGVGFRLRKLDNSAAAWGAEQFRQSA